MVVIAINTSSSPRTASSSMPAPSISIIVPAV